MCSGRYRVVEGCLGDGPRAESRAKPSGKDGEVVKR